MHTLDASRWGLSIPRFGCVPPQSRPARQVVAVGWKPLCRAHWANRFDLLVLGISLASFFPAELPGNRVALLIDGHPVVSDLLELPRAIRVLRCGSVQVVHAIGCTIASRVL